MKNHVSNVVARIADWIEFREALDRSHPKHVEILQGTAEALYKRFLEVADYATDDLLKEARLEIQRRSATAYKKQQFRLKRRLEEKLKELTAEKMKKAA